ncbi:MAG: right-handed parallel beta-helix repeat-containing protein [Thermoplasmata archaeon]|nr:right-handed parallel beta-helix repeat-containing protein [Thermoplasmata archaeon]
MLEMKKLMLIVIVSIFILQPINISDSGSFSAYCYQKHVGGNILYVGGSGPNNYTGIQSAIDDAEDGDTIFVFNGTYHENVVVNKSLSLIGENMRTTIIDGNGKRAIIINSNNSLLKNFTIANCSGIRINGNFNTISNNIITAGEKHRGDGVYLNDGTHDNIICNNIISGYSSGDCDGVLLRYDGYNCYILNNSIYDCRYAILVNCIGYTITGNKINDSDYGVYIASFGEKQCFVNNNHIFNVEYGICIESFTPACYIENNTIENVNTGIRIIDGTKNATVKNNILYKGYYGIRVYHKNIVNRNEINDFIYGIEAIGDNNVITENNFVNNTRNAVFMYTPNKWDNNYWYNWKGKLPKPIFGMTGELALIPWVEFDYHPANKPWKIGGER